MTEIRVALSQDMLQAFAQIPQKKQKKVNEFITKFRSNPTAPGINYEKINDAADSHYRSTRIDQEYRCIVLKPEQGNVYVLLWVDKHDAAYDWARRQKCQLNPVTGSIQIYETVHHGEEAVPVEQRGTLHEVSNVPPLFELRDRELLRLGVPEDRLAWVKKISSSEELRQYRRKLPQDAFEALEFLAEGLSLDEVMTDYAVPDGPEQAVDFDQAFDNERTQRRFKVVENDLELQAMLDAPLEQWRVFLHPSQRRLVERHWNGPVRVLGGAGTGKTVVAMHRARWLASNVLEPGEKLLFTTFSRNLATDIKANLETLCDSEQLKKIEVMNIDAWVHRFVNKQHGQARIVFPDSDEYHECWRLSMGLTDSAVELPESFYRDEWERVVLPNRVITEKDYYRVSRVGRGVALSRKQRAAIWPVFAEMRAQLGQRYLMTQEDAAFFVMDMIRDGIIEPQYRAAIIDEAQDFGMETLALIRELVAKDVPDDLFIVGDGHQRIYGKKATLSKVGINIVGRGRKLRINYRTTDRIRRFATAVLEGVEVDDLNDDLDSTAGYRSLIEGDEPVLKGFDTPDDEAEWVAGEIAAMASDDEVEVGLEDICVIGRIRSSFRSVKKALDALGLQSHALETRVADNSTHAGVRFATMHRAKGLEFKVVFLVGIRAGVVPLKVAMASTQDPVELKAKELNERALLHVAGSRAVQGLYVSWSGQPSPYVVARDV